MIEKSLIKALTRLDKLIERLQDILQNARLMILEMTWDIKEKENKKQSKLQVLLSTKPSSSSSGPS